MVWMIYIIGSVANWSRKITEILFEVYQVPFAYVLYKLTSRAGGASAEIEEMADNKRKKRKDETLLTFDSNYKINPFLKTQMKKNHFTVSYGTWCQDGCLLVEMPLHYTGVVREHLVVRHQVGLLMFHMGGFWSVDHKRSISSNMCLATMLSVWYRASARRLYAKCKRNY